MRLESESAKAKGDVAAELTLGYFHIADVSEKTQSVRPVLLRRTRVLFKAGKVYGFNLAHGFVLSLALAASIVVSRWDPVCGRPQLETNEGPGHRRRRGLLGQTRDEGQATGSAEADRSRKPPRTIEQPGGRTQEA